MRDFEPIYSRVVSDLVNHHSKISDEPLLLAIRFFPDEDIDLGLLEVIGNFPGNSDDEIFETTISPNADLTILGCLHLLLSSPEQLRSSITRGDEIVNRIRNRSSIVFVTNGTDRELANNLVRDLGISNAS